ncbi:MAG: hypothetical protein KDD83_02620, partial [Caldilineaceae bacterium]|nr:hypothetical protein [Caldilineaceae bacterium]
MLPRLNLAKHDAEHLVEILCVTDTPLTAAEPELCLLAAEACFVCTQLDSALTCFELARLGLAQQMQVGLHSLCLLRMAQIHHRLEDNDTAAFYTDRAAALLTGRQDVDPQFLGELYLGLARLAPDIGRLGACRGYAEQALVFFEQAGDSANQFDALMLQALAAQQTGDLRRADMLLGVAQQLIDAAGLDVHAQLFVANTRAHVAWYSGDLPGAQQAATDAITLADAHASQSKQRVYNRLVRANVLRDQGEFDAARQDYAEVAELTRALNFAGFQPWIDVNLAWLE